MSNEPGGLQAKLDDLTRSVAALEQRLEVIEARLRIARPVASPGEAGAPVEPALPAELDLGTGAALLGRTLLVLGGGYLVRALTEAKALPGPTGMVLGLVYALSWMVLASRAVARGRRTSAIFHVIGSGLVAFPLVWESTTRFEILTPALAAAVLLGLTGSFLFLAWRQELPAAAWVGVLGATGAGLALQVTSGSFEPPAILLLLLGVAVVWLARTRSWPGLEAVTGIVAVFAALVVGTGALSRGATTDPRVALAILVGLFLLYTGSLLLGTLRGERRAGPFEVVQVALVILVGLGGAALVAIEIGPTVTASLGVAALAAGLAVYALVLLHPRLRGGGAAFQLFASVGWVLAAAGARIVVEPPGIGLSLLALGAGTLAIRRAGPTLHLHASLFLLLAALADGLLRQAFGALVAPHAGGALLPFTAVHGSIVLAAAVCVVLPVAGRPQRAQGATRWIEYGLSLIVLLGTAGLAVRALEPLAASRGELDPARLAVLRTGVLASLTVLTAALSRLPPMRLVSSLVYPLLVVDGVKLLVEDFFLERPRHLVVALAFYAAALILAPRVRAVTVRNADGGGESTLAHTDT